MTARTALISLALVALATPADGRESWTAEQQGVLDAIAALSAATAPDGGGAAAYAAILADDYSRWTMGAEDLNEKKAWVEGVAGWFEDGWRVVDRETRYLEITVEDDRAAVRRIVHETYRGPDGDRSDSGAALAETWVRREGRWLLWRVNVQTLDD